MGFDAGAMGCEETEAQKTKRQLKNKIHKKIKKLYNLVEKNN
jgi:hypothetical protein